MKNNLISFLVFGISVILPSNAVWADQANGMSNESEAGVVITGGNTDVSTLSFKENATLKEDHNSYNLKGRYLRSSNGGIEQALEWGLGVRYERTLNGRLGVFLGQLVESNIYQNIFQRYATDLGGKYTFQQKEKDLIWFAEGGYRFTRENYAYSFKNLSFLRLYTEVEKYFSETVSTKLWLEYLPNLSSWKGYQFNSNLSLNSAISTVFSLKSGFEFRYNNDAPSGVKSASDRIFTTSLVAKI